MWIINRSQSAVGKIELVDMFSKVVMELFTGKFTSEIMEFDVSHLPAGVYFVRMDLGNKCIVEKLIKQ